MRGLEVVVRMVSGASRTVWTGVLLASLCVGCSTTRRERDVHVPGPESAGTRPADARSPGQATPFGAVAPEGPARKAEDISGPAALSLLEQARAALGRGASDQAVASLERALRIEPRNPFLWQALAGTRLAQSLPEQAESVARRSNSLAHGNPWIESENWRLIAEARAALGDEVGALQAEERYAQLLTQINE